MTLVRSFVKYLEKSGYGKFGKNLYIYRVPNSMKTETEVMWFIPSGGSVIRNTNTGSKIKGYQILVYFRSNSARKVDEVLSHLEEVLNCAGCVQLEGFELVDIQATQFPVDQDLDSENRMVGFVQVQLQVYKGCDE